MGALHAQALLSSEGGLLARILGVLDSRKSVFQVIHSYLLHVLVGAESQLNSASAFALIGQRVDVNLCGDHVLHPRHLLNIYIINMWRQVLQVEVNDFVFVPTLVEVHLGALTGAKDVAAQVPLLVRHRISAL